MATTEYFNDQQALVVFTTVNQGLNDACKMTNSLDALKKVSELETALSAVQLAPKSFLSKDKAKIAGMIDVSAKSLIDTWKDDASYTQPTTQEIAASFKNNLKMIARVIEATQPKSEKYDPNTYFGH